MQRWRAKLTWSKSVIENHAAMPPSPPLLLLLFYPFVSGCRLIFLFPLLGSGLCHYLALSLERSHRHCWPACVTLQRQLHFSLTLLPVFIKATDSLLPHRHIRNPLTPDWSWECWVTEMLWPLEIISMAFSCLSRLSFIYETVT